MAENELPRPLQFYTALFRCAFDFLDGNSHRINLLNNEYVTFSEQLLEYFNKEHKGKEYAKNSNFFVSNVLSE